MSRLHWHVGIYTVKLADFPCAPLHHSQDGMTNRHATTSLWTVTMNP